MFLHLAVGR
jgi:hypothetical protein